MFLFINNLMQDKTKNNWDDRASFRAVPNKYTLIEIDYGADAEVFIIFNINSLSNTSISLRKKRRRKPRRRRKRKSSAPHPSWMSVCKTSSNSFSILR